MTQWRILSAVRGLNSEFFFSRKICLIKIREPRLPYYLTIDGKRILGFVLFKRVLALCEVQKLVIWVHCPFQILVNITPHTHTYTNTCIYVWVCVYVHVCACVCDCVSVCVQA